MSTYQRHRRNPAGNQIEVPTTTVSTRPRRRQPHDALWHQRDEHSSLVTIINQSPSPNRAVMNSQPLGITPCPRPGNQVRHQGRQRHRICHVAGQRHRSKRAVFHKPEPGPPRRQVGQRQRKSQVGRGRTTPWSGSDAGTAAVSTFSTLTTEPNDSSWLHGASPAGCGSRPQTSRSTASDIITGAGPGGGHVRVFSGVGGSAGQAH